MKVILVGNCINSKYAKVTGFPVNMVIRMVRC